MEEPLVPSVEEPMNKIEISEKQSSVSSVKDTKTTKPTMAATSNLLTPTGSIRKITEPKRSSDSRSNVTKPTVTASSRRSNPVPVIQRNGNGGVPEKSSSINGKIVLLMLQAQELLLHQTKVRKSHPVSATDKSLRPSTGSDVCKLETIKKPSVKPALSISSSSKRLLSTSLDSSGTSVSRKTVSKVSSPSVRSPSVSRASRTGSLSRSMDRSFNWSERRRMGTPESRDSRFIVLPPVEIKAGDDVVSILLSLNL
ncbi:hypothetical protein GH714_017152 [Hevea brasiliensis]|uniref:Uncharacterized protein n=1 Tax=Hevea brasiliensis TaxID=3981 RepID=A0A6A6MBY8_HEVBR|nr:hypothetical protein GH714_017152 [Hevea brasiliensis]